MDNADNPQPQIPLRSAVLQQGFDALTAALAQAPDAARPQTDVAPALPPTLRLLHTINFRQWNLESDIRSKGLGAERIAHLKREIEASNDRRITAMEAFDRELDSSFGTMPRGAG